MSNHLEPTTINTKSNMIPIMVDDNWRDELHAAFARFDQDRSGRIARSEFDQLLNSLGSTMSVRDRDIGFKMVDQDSDGTITEAELAAWWDIVREG